MKFKNLFLLLIVGLMLASCEDIANEQEPELDQSTNTSSFSGVWKRDDGASFIEISGSSAKLCSNGSNQEWTGSFSSSENKLSFTISGSTYHFYLEISNSNLIVYQSYSGNHEGKQVYIKSSNYPCTSSGGSGDGSGDGSGSGGGGSTNNSSVVFWTIEDLGCGSISVSLTNEGTGTISSYYTSGAPDCGASGCANFSGLAAGTYSYTASCSSYTWGSSFTIDANTCLTYQLR